MDNIFFMDFNAWYDLPLYIQYSLILLLGCCIGSFINVVVYRLPVIFEQDFQTYIKQQEAEKNGLSPEEILQIYNDTQKISLLSPPSRCTNCGYKLHWYDNIPILSWLYLLGKCRKCKTAISTQYPIIELIAGLGAVLCYFTLNHAASAFLAMVFYWLLLTIVILDAKTQLLPNELSMPIICLGLLCSTQNIFLDANSAIWGSIAAFLLLWLVALIFKVIRGYEGLGSGDPYLLAGIAAWIGLEQALYTIFYASILGIIYVILRLIIKKEQISSSIAFGPFIAIVGFILFIIKNMYN